MFTIIWLIAWWMTNFPNIVDRPGWLVFLLIALVIDAS